MSRRVFFYAAAGPIWILFILTACNMPVPIFTLPSATPVGRTIPFPSTPTPTSFRPPLTRLGDISAAEYGRQLNVLVGDTFVLHRLKGDRESLNVEFPQVLQAEGDLKAAAVVLKAVGVGTTRVSTLIDYPCPAAAKDCRPPDPFLYLQVTVSNPLIFIPYVHK
jgi:hypothetical protein